jgi:multiple sugar transport system ATP-binding protein
MNFLNGDVDRQARVFTNDAICLQLDEPQLASLDRLGAAEQVILGIRPEHVSVSAVPHDGWLPANVYVTELMGSETFVFLTLGDKRIIARAPADFRAEVSSLAWIQIETTKAHFFHPTSGERLGE